MTGFLLYAAGVVSFSSFLRLARLCWRRALGSTEAK